MSANGELDFERGGQCTFISRPDYYRDVANPVREETPTFANSRNHDSGDGRSDNSRTVEHGRVQCDRVHQIFFADHVYEERLPAGNIERIDYAEQRCENEHWPHTPFLYPPRQRQDREHQGENHRCNLSCNDNSLPIESVCNCAPKWGD
jgi:hypothetical protein